GEVVMQAQHNAMTFNAAQHITVTSTEDEIVISTPKTLTLNGGGSYLKLSGEGVEHGSQGPMIMNVAQYLIPAGGADLPMETPDFKTSEISVITRNVPKWASE
ncbi:DUF2345 domain-containing protein, partial [Vibrio sp.]|uniref:DUF2345 domain-containing protein n=1 Tax=Vibrio sp. TaxID=678 RepID=UPI003AA839DD